MLNKNLTDIKSNNIRLSVYDSSSDNETELLTKQFSDLNYNIYYKRLAYDYRIAWTWEEMDKRNKSNDLKDKIRLAC